MKSNFFKKTMQLIGLFIILGLAWLSIVSNKSVEMPPNIAKNPSHLVCNTSNMCLSEIITMARIEAIDMEKLNEFFKDCKLVKQNDNYGHFACQNNFMQFVEDVEIYLKEDKIMYRSASRVNHLLFYGHNLRIKRFIIFLESITNPN